MGDAEGDQRDGHRPEEGRRADPHLSGDIEPADPLRRPGAGGEDDDRHAERGAAGDAEDERIGQRIAEDRLHLRPAQAEGGAGEAGGDGALQAHLAHDVQGPFGRLLGPHQGVEHLAGRQAHRPEGQGGEDGDQQQSRQRREHDDLSRPRRVPRRHGCGRDYDGGTSLRNTNSWSGTSSGWSALM